MCKCEDVKMKRTSLNISLNFHIFTFSHFHIFTLICTVKLQLTYRIRNPLIGFFFTQTLGLKWLTNHLFIQLDIAV